MEYQGLETLADISSLIRNSHDLEETLHNIVTLVARRMRTEVCSLYLQDPDSGMLLLRATQGLAAEAVGNVAMPRDKGLVGLVVEKQDVVNVRQPEEHPRFYYFAATQEERYHSFLGVPLFDRHEAIGVIAIQTRETREFTTSEIRTLTTIAFQVAAVVVNARLLDSMQAKEQEAVRLSQKLAQIEQTATTAATGHNDSGPQQALRGRVAYPGVISGRAHILEAGMGFGDIWDNPDTDCQQQWQQLQEALVATRDETHRLQERMARTLTEDDAAIFHTHLLILEDRSFQEKLHSAIFNGHSAAYALKKVVKEYAKAMRELDDPYLQERAADLKDIGRRLLAHLLGHHQGPQPLHQPGILLAKELLPSDMATLDHSKILGIATASGEQHSHAVIMARSLGIPALVGIKDLLERAQPEDWVILDGNSGCLYLNPQEAVLKEYSRLEEDNKRQQARWERYRQLPALTADHVAITLRGNIGLISDVAVAQHNGAEGVGLYRTEFPHMTRDAFPDRQQQYELYRRVVSGFEGQPVTIRTLDIGGDKALPYFAPPQEDNPFMGWRSVRVSLAQEDIFRTQLEAILLAAQHGPVKLLLPMIGSLEEVEACRAILAQARHQLQQEGLDGSQPLPLGVMIEVPAAVQLAPALAREVDFFALGSNDLIQYMLATDRNNTLVRQYYNPLHPAVLQALNQVANTMKEQGKPLCLCGEMASQPAYLLLLVGMGITEFSVAAPFIPRLKEALSRINSQEAQKLCQQILGCHRSQQIYAHLAEACNRLGIQPPEPPQPLNKAGTT